jgi:hypothetical protein
LRYLSDKSLAKAIITGTYEIPLDMDPATTLILEEIGRLGVKLVNKEGTKFIITPEDFKIFWKKVGNLPHHQCQEYTTGTTRQQSNATSAPKSLPSNSRW